MMMNINELAKEQYDWVEKMGWHKDRRVLEALALISSGVGEAVNECRGDEPTDKFTTELVDIILRTLDLAYQYEPDIEKVIKAKMAINYSNGTKGRVI